MAAKSLFGWTRFFHRGSRRTRTESPGDVDLLAGPLPVQRREFLTPAERAFLGVLRLILETHVLICPKVRVGDVMRVVDQCGDIPLADILERSHVDFLLCDPATLHVLCAIELDDITQWQQDRQAVDSVIAAAFASAKIRMLRFPAKSTYTPHEITERLNDVVRLPDDRRRS